MSAAAPLIWAFIGFWTHLAGAVACALVAVWYLRNPVGDPIARRAVAAALGLTAIWCLLVAGYGPFGQWAFLSEAARNLGWIWVLQALFAGQDAGENGRRVRPVLYALALVTLLQPVLLGVGMRFGAVPGIADVLFNISTLFHLLVAIGALLLLHNLYLGASPARRTLLRWPAAAITTLWAFDLNYYTIAYLASGEPHELAAIRGAVTAFATIPLAIGASRVGADRAFRPSRKVTFQTISLIAIGVYLVAMVVISRALSALDGDIARLSQIGFVFIASLAALVWLPSRRLRAWLRVTVTKHLFQHRYDYRAEWLRFAATIGRDGSDTTLEQRVLQALADITDSQRGLLLTPAEEGTLQLATRWKWPLAQVPAEPLDAAVASRFEQSGYIVDLDEVRSGRENPDLHGMVPDWLLEESDAWAIVPLIHFRRLVGIAVLARPEGGRKLDWEDLDLLRTVGQQAAAFLAEQVGQNALQEASRFDEFNRRMAFVMHDVKNLASQLALLARNAEKHADNPAFRADMLVTLRHSSDRLNALIARLGRYGHRDEEELERVDLEALAAETIRRFAHAHDVVLVQSAPVEVNAGSEALQQAVDHLVQNAIDASESGTPVFLRVAAGDLYGEIEIIDSGTGMTAEFQRNELFRPFQSTKAGGFGIGAYEARELIRAMGGNLAVESREGLGSRFLIRLPRHAVSELNANPKEVA